MTDKNSNSEMDFSKSSKIGWAAWYVYPNSNFESRAVKLAKLFGLNKKYAEKLLLGEYEDSAVLLALRGMALLKHYGLLNPDDSTSMRIFLGEEVER